MLVEINLLPKKNNRSRMMFVIIALLIFLLILLLSFYGWQLKAKEAELKETEEQLSTTLNLIEMKNQQLSEYNSSTSVKELEQAIQWADTQSFDAVYLIDELTKMLPERGFILEFEMDENNKINQVVQFDTKSDAAYYLSTLLANDWIEEAVISEAKVEQDFAEEEKNDGEQKEPASVQYMNENNLLPRYSAQYEIILNLTAFEQAAGKADEKKKGDEPS
nr:fimbrial assembly protein [uncultured Bacillus sp.]